MLRYTRSSTDADKLARRRRVYRSVKVNKHSTIPYRPNRYSFLLCNINFVFKTRRFPILDFKNAVTLKSGQRSLKIIESGTIRQIVYGFY